MSSRLGTALLDLLFPPRCAFCRKLIESQKQGICDHCQKELPWLIGAEAQQKFEFISLCVSPLRFQGDVRESIHRYKFSGRSGYAKTYGTLMTQCVLDHLDGQYDRITWVPLSARSFRKRGYDQARLLAEEVARQNGLTAVETLRKIRKTGQQSLIRSPSERKANVMGAYEVTDPAEIQGKRVLLVDDVVTTGATLSECARTLRISGVSDVVCVTLCRASGAK